MKTINQIGKEIDFNCFICNKKLIFDSDSLFFYCIFYIHHSLYISIGTRGEIFSMDIVFNDKSNKYLLLFSVMNAIDNYVSLFCNSKFVCKINNFDILISKDIINDFKKILLLI